MAELFSSLTTLEWIYLAFFGVGLLYALFLAIFGLGGGHGLEHAGDLHGMGHVDLGHGADLGHGMDLGHGADLGHGMDLGHGADLGHGMDLGHGADLGHGVDLGHGADVGHGEAAGHGLDIDGDGQGQPVHLLPWNPLVIATFLGGLGGFGILGTRLWGMGTFFSLLLAIPAGLALAAGFYFLYAFLMRQAGDSSAATWHEIRNVTARVVTPIPEKGLGEIVYEVRGSRYNAPAKSIDGLSIPAGAKVTVLDVVSGIAMVDVRFVE